MDVLVTTSESPGSSGFLKPTDHYFHFSLVEEPSRHWPVRQIPRPFEDVSLSDEDTNILDHIDPLHTGHNDSA
jgi:hypothetical protein